MWVHTATMLSDLAAVKPEQINALGLDIPDDLTQVSVSLWRSGLYRRVGWKHDSWHDVACMQLDVLGAAEQDRPPTLII
jgi:hypothetical protein